MSYVIAMPEFLSAAATDLASIGSAISTGSAVAAGPTTGLLATAGDEVSAAITALFSDHAREYQAISAQIEQFHQRFVAASTNATQMYAATEDASASPLADLSPVQLLSGGGAAGSADAIGGAGGTGGRRRRRPR